MRAGVRAVRGLCEGCARAVRGLCEGCVSLRPVAAAFASGLAAAFLKGLGPQVNVCLGPAAPKR